MARKEVPKGSHMVAATSRANKDRFPEWMRNDIMDVSCADCGAELIASKSTTKQVSSMLGTNPLFLCQKCHDDYNFDTFVLPDHPILNDAEGN